MTHKEYKELLKHEIFRGKNYIELSFFQKIRFKYFTPNTNCVFLARRMWYYYSCGGIKKAYSRLIYLKIFRKYGCCIFPNCRVGRGFWITHPVGIVMGKCIAGDNLMVFQNSTIGVKKLGDVPVLGNNVSICSNSIVIGNIKLSDNITIGANSFVNRDLLEPETYVGNPVKRVNKK